ncbi:MAG: glycosyltransferase family 2 protein [Phycisphaerales bacterium]
MPSPDARLPMSAAIVCKNNRDTIARTLETVAGLASQIVAVDSGSTDGTIALLEQFGCTIIRSAWLGHVKTKQVALEACTHPWVLCIDSDESIEPDLARSIREALLAPATACPGYDVNRKIYYRGVPLNHAWQPEWRTRLVRRDAFRWGGLDPHDSLGPIAPGVTTRRLRGTLRHDSISTFADFFVKQASHARTMAQSLHAAGERGSLGRLLTSPIGALAKQVIVKQAWRDGYAGWLAAASTAAGTLIKHAVLIELSRMPGPPTSPGTDAVPKP